MLRNLHQRKLEHCVRRDRAGDAAGELDQDVEEEKRRRKLAQQQEHERHRRIEMRTGDRCERVNQHEQDCACRRRVAEQRHSRVPVGERFRHHARANDGCDEQPRPKELGRQSPSQIERDHG